MAGGRNKEATAKTATRSQRALQLRAQGHTYREIETIIRKEFENETHYTFQSAKKDCDRAMKQICVENSQSLRMLREMEIVRLNYWLSKLSAKIERGDTDAINTALKISNHRAKLMGLYAPVEIRQLIHNKEILDEMKEHLVERAEFN